MLGVQILKLVNLASLYFFQFPRLLRRVLQKWVAASVVCPSVAGALCRGALNHQCGYLKIFSHGLCMLCLSLPGIVASDIVITTLLITLAYSLLLLTYIYFAVAATPPLLEVLTSYYVLSHKAIS